MPARTPKDVKQIARKHTAAAIKTLVGIMNQPKAPPAARVSAANAVLDRGWGKSPQPVAVGGDDDRPIEHIHRVIIGSEDTNG